MRYCIAILYVCFSFTTFAQSFEPLQEKPILLLNATIHIGNGNLINNGILAFEKGKITLLGDATVSKYNADNYTIFNVQQQHIYPGLIAPNSQLGLIEIELARATSDRFEIGGFNPNVRSIIAYNTDSKVIPTVRTNGILIAQIVPAGGTICGTSSIVELDAWNWEDAAYAIDGNMHINWPTYYSYAYQNGVQISVNLEYAKQIYALEQFFDEAKAYCTNTNQQIKNLRFEAMRNVFANKTKLFITANATKEIIGAVQFAQKYNQTPVIVGGAESYLIPSFLRENKISVLINRVHALPSLADNDIDIAYKLPSILQKEGVLVGIAIGGSGDAFWNMRNLPFEAGTAANYGLTQEEALMCITLNNAKILGIDKTLGSLEVGKDATLIISEGDVLDMRTSKITQAFISGRKIETQNWQEDTYIKFAKKYGIEAK